ncbi:hypothetical protein [Actinomadura sp. 21ATH]|uniref:hypothetical protein n=1 Tax=Actinomadura sp. 21ATH TaxID=1735444 RepID=UPI0035C0D703
MRIRAVTGHPLATALTTILTASILTACSGSEAPRRPGRTASAASSAASPSPGAVPGQDWRRNRACVSGHDMFTTQAAPYRRNAPNKIAEEWFDGSYEGVATIPPFPRDDDALLARTLLPDGWKPDARDGYRSTAASLVLCHTATATGKRRIMTCKFTVMGAPGPRSIPVVPGTHHFEVYESRTGRFVASFELESSEHRPAAPCPDSAYNVSKADVIAQPPSQDALTEKLRPLHEGTR